MNRCRYCGLWGCNKEAYCKREYSRPRMPWPEGSIKTFAEELIEDAQRMPTRGKRKPNADEQAGDRSDL